jgi:hypothetical protein
MGEEGPDRKWGLNEIHIDTPWRQMGSKQEAGVCGVSSGEIELPNGLRGY